MGDDFFADAAMRYRRERPSRSGNLQEFGADFPDFLESLPGARYLAYLGDVARLEWLRQETALAPDPTVADARAAPRVDLHPSVRLLASPHAVLTLWKYAIAGGGDRLQLPVPGEHVLLWRSGDEVGMACVDTATFAYVMALRAGSPIEIARHAAIRHDPEFAAEACLASLADEALIRFIHPAVEDTTP